MKQYTILPGESVEMKGQGYYTIYNQSVTDTLEVVGGVNSTMLFELGELSYASIYDSGVKLFNNAGTGQITATVNYIKDTLEVTYPLKGLTFCVDAGHGGKDPGAVNGSHQEKDTALAISLELARLLDDAGASVLLTRDDDTYPSLSERAKMANNARCTAFISIHLNSAENKTATGFEVLVYNSQSSSRANELAINVMNQMAKTVTWPNRGIKDRPDLAVLKNTSMPAILVEVGFISNDAESKALQNKETQEAIANAIFNGVIETYA